MSDLAVKLRLRARPFPSDGWEQTYTSSLLMEASTHVERLETVSTYISLLSIDRGFEGGRGEIVDNIEDIIDGRLSEELIDYLEGGLP